jgi:DNA-binding MurR/RpiR family transcriptional regulator
MPLTVPIDEELRLALPDLTRAERQLASHILSNYPVAALGSITHCSAAGAKAWLQRIS